MSPTICVPCIPAGGVVVPAFFMAAANAVGHCPVSPPWREGCSYPHLLFWWEGCYPPVEALALRADLFTMKTLRIIASLIVAAMIIGLILGGMNTARSAHDERVAEEIAKERARIDRLADACAQRWPRRFRQRQVSVEGGVLVRRENC